MLIHLIKKLALFSFVFYSGLIAAKDTLSYDKAWGVATIIGSVADKSSFKYYLEPQLRLIGTRTVFNQVQILGGFGYQVNKDIMLFIGPGWVATKTAQTRNEFFEKRFWQQLLWRVVDNPNWTLNSRTRLEERRLTTAAPVAFRFRERIWLRAPFKKWQGYSFSCFDEFFLNMNHPHWTSPYTLEQNRAFVGFARQLSSTTILDLGYLNQYLHATTNQLNHILLFSFTVTM